MVQTWPKVLAGTLTADSSVLGDWGQLSDDAVVDDVEIVIGVYKDVFVAIYDVDPHAGWQRLGDGRVQFNGTTTNHWAHLIGMANPGWTFSRPAVSRAVQPIPLTTFTAATEPVTVDKGASRAIVGGLRAHRDRFRSHHPRAAGSHADRRHVLRGRCGTPSST